MGSGLGFRVYKGLGFRVSVIQMVPLCLKVSKASFSKLVLEFGEKSSAQLSLPGCNKDGLDTDPRYFQLNPCCCCCWLPLNPKP